MCCVVPVAYGEQSVRKGRGDLRVSSLNVTGGNSIHSWVCLRTTDIMWYFENYCAFSMLMWAVVNCRWKCISCFEPWCRKLMRQESSPEGSCATVLGNFCCILHLRWGVGLLLLLGYNGKRRHLCWIELFHNMVKSAYMKWRAKGWINGLLHIVMKVARFQAFEQLLKVEKAHGKELTKMN